MSRPRVLIQICLVWRAAQAAQVGVPVVNGARDGAVTCSFDAPPTEQEFICAWTRAGSDACMATNTYLAAMAVEEERPCGLQGQPLLYWLPAENGDESCSVSISHAEVSEWTCSRRSAAAAASLVSPGTPMHLGEVEILPDPDEDFVVEFSQVSMEVIVLVGGAYPEPWVTLALVESSISDDVIIELERNQTDPSSEVVNALDHVSEFSIRGWSSEPFVMDLQVTVFQPPFEGRRWTLHVRSERDPDGDEGHIGPGKLAFIILLPIVLVSLVAVTLVAALYRSRSLCFKRALPRARSVNSPTPSEAPLEVAASRSTAKSSFPKKIRVRTSRPTDMTNGRSLSFIFPLEAKEPGTLADSVEFELNEYDDVMVSPPPLHLHSSAVAAEVLVMPPSLNGTGTKKSNSDLPAAARWERDYDDVDSIVGGDHHNNNNKVVGVEDDDDHGALALASRLSLDEEAFVWTEDLPGLGSCTVTANFDPGESGCAYSSDDGLMAVTRDEQLTVLQRDLDWTCVRNARGQTGFVPTSVIAEPHPS